MSSVTLTLDRQTCIRLPKNLSDGRSKQDYKLLTLYIITGILLVIVGCQVIELLNITSASDINAFKMRLESGIFRDEGATTPLVAFVERCINEFVKNILPIMSIVSITWILITLIATILYLFRQPFFDEVYIAKKAYKSEKQSLSSIIMNRDFSSITNSNTLKTHGFLKCCIVPDFKSLAFYEASDGPMTVGDFIKQNAFKCMTMIAFCVMISDQTMLDLFYQGGSIGVYFFKKLAYDYDYTQIIDNFLTIGSDYNAPWNTSNNNIEGKNKTKVYDEVYKLLKSGCKTNATRTTEFKSQMGRTLAGKIDLMKDVPWGRETFVASAELLPNASSPTNIPGESYYFNVQEFGFDPGVSENMTGYIHVRIVSELDVQNGGVVKTTYPEAWSVSGNTATLDMSKVITSANVTVSQVRENATAVFRVETKDTAEIVNINAKAQVNGSQITITWNPPQGGKLLSVSVGGIKIGATDANGGKISGIKTDWIMHYKADDTNNVN